MGRGGKGLPEGTDKRAWALKFVEAVAPYAAAIKPNAQYWKRPGSAGEQIKGDLEILAEVSALAHSLDLAVIDDSKYADIGDTNDAGIFYAGKRPVEAVTFSPFAGNMEEAVGQAHKKGVGLIPMCLMSNKQYKKEKLKKVDISEEIHDYDALDLISVEDRKDHVHQYIQLAHDAKKFGADAIVIGAPSEKNHITDYNIKRARANAGDNMLVLLPGVGHQGGEAGKIWQYFSPEHVIVNVARALMFPEEGKGHAETAKFYMQMLNDKR